MSRDRRRIVLWGAVFAMVGVAAGVHDGHAFGWSLLFGDLCLGVGIILGLIDRPERKGAP